MAKLNDGQITYFLGTLCPEADITYRFAYSLYLDDDLAFKATTSAFEAAIADLKAFQKADDDPFLLRQKLMHTIWDGFDAGKAAKNPSSPLGKKLAAIAPEPRSMMVAIDVCGLRPTEALKMYGVDEDSFRSHLAAARNILIG